MDSKENWLIHDHRRYEDALSRSKVAAEGGDWRTAIGLFEAFVDDLRLHMRIEDEVIFPTVEGETGDPDGAVAELREEHRDLVRLLRDLNYVMKTKNVDHLVGSLGPLREAMQHHNDHEEAVLLLVADESLLRRRDEVVARLDVSRLGRWDF